ncbi:hypothetical protein N7491_010451 [Penicillium cf. griseofulvum]|uniref:Uncharacterized protein n=1 Tax=Penicillium cf. griseofulvum TaxID=2972120 RepID=A0A9W9MZV4_9EURO|nr:hypothetical protein N7472_000783 [Penicillium cf. griseofulvum]KAJ5422006.1 hypothetical protein N7491_010451 [Penicillium cf. griseofulvum]KAJ5428198.1 hypothetical protein N7445_009652 [Penicillium cf. griseofulvum]
MKANVVTSNLEFDPLTRVKKKSTTTTVAIAVLKSTPMTDNMTHPQSSTSTQEAQMTHFTVCTITPHHQHKVLLLVLLWVWGPPLPAVVRRRGKSYYTENN